MKNLSRRAFAGGAALTTAASYSRILGANDRISLGYIGVGNRGDQLHGAFLEYGDCQTAAICDLRDDHVDFAVNKSRATPKRYKEYRKLIEDKSVDAVVIATPDHWHALMFIDACNAGKDVYVEKPLSLTVVEGRKMVEAAERTQRVSQVGIHRRSSVSLKEAADYVRSGGIGKVTVAKGFHIQNEWPNGIGKPPDGPPPNEWEWDQWLGPAPKVAYNRNRTYYNFRWFYDYSGGQLTNFGVHRLDLMRWCLGQDSPIAVTAMGGKFAIEDNREIPDTLEVLWKYQGTLMVFCQYNANAAPGAFRDGLMGELRGTKGTLYLYSARWEVVPEATTEMLFGYVSPLDRQRGQTYRRSKRAAIQPRKADAGSDSSDTVRHARNFLDCIKSRAKCNCDVLTGHLSNSATLIGNIALKTESYLKWDAGAERFTNNQAANRYLHYQYRAPYKLG
jgi:predicted dehydrogenase